MQRKMNRQPSAHVHNTHNSTIITAATELAQRHSEIFLQQVLHPRGIKVISDTYDLDALGSLQEYLGNPGRPVLKQVLGNAFVELAASEVAKVFEAMKMYGEN